MITSLRTRILLITTTAVTTALVLTGGATYAIVRSATLQTIEENLAAIASGNTLAIEKWVAAKATAVTATAAVVEPGDPKGLEQIIMQVNKLIDVIHCSEHDATDAVVKEHLQV